MPQEYLRVSQVVGTVVRGSLLHSRPWVGCRLDLAFRSSSEFLSSLYARIYAYMLAYTRIGEHIRVYVCIYAYMLAYTRMCEHIRVYANIYAYMRAYTNICEHIRVYAGALRRENATTLQPR